MRKQGVARTFAVTLVVLTLVAPAVLAQAASEPEVEGQNKLSYWPTPKSENAASITDLFSIVMSIAIFVFIFVEGLLLYVIFRFRRNRNVPRDETHRGHTKAEIVWTIIPAAILLFIGVISAQTMEATDKIPDDVQHVVNVTGYQWAWNFEYPDGSTSSNLFVQAGQRVRLDITSTDIIHAAWIPNLGIKMDAVPGRVNSVWIEPNEPGTYILKCAEFCYAHPTDSGIGHHSMISQVVVCDAAAADCAEIGEPQGCVETTEVRVLDPARFDPPNICVRPGTTVTWTWEGNAPHTVTPDDQAAWGGETGSELKNSGTYTFTFNDLGEFGYHCLPHSFQQDGRWVGMVGVVNVTAAPATETA